MFARQSNLMSGVSGPLVTGLSSGSSRPSAHPGFQARSILILWASIHTAFLFPPFSVIDPRSLGAPAAHRKGLTGWVTRYQYGFIRQGGTAYLQHPDLYAL
jgi:hypothetical protein